MIPSSSTDENLTIYQHYYLSVGFQSLMLLLLSFDKQMAKYGGS
jgi:hypothetical protein